MTLPLLVCTKAKRISDTYRTHNRNTSTPSISSEKQPRAVRPRARARAALRPVLGRATPGARARARARNGRPTRARAAAAADRGDLGGPRALTSLDRRARADATAQRLLAATRAVRELTGAVAERRRVGGGAQCGGATSARLARRQPPGATSIGARSGKCCPPRTRSASRACASTPACLRRRRA